MNNRTLLHEGGHGHEGCCGAHSHADGACHSHGTSGELSAEQTVVLLGYMLEHNKSHADELHGVVHALEHQGKTEAAALLDSAVALFNDSNVKLEEVLRLVKGE